jgi:flagellar assembly protein FliH
MLKAVFRPQELVTLPDRLVINSPTSFPDLAHLAPVEEVVEDLKDIDEYKGPTADDLRREAEMFKSNWEEEKERMVSAAKAEAEDIINDAQKAAFNEIKRKTDEAQVIKQQAEEEAQRIADDAKVKAAELQSEVKKNLESERKEARDKGREEGRNKGFEEGKAEVERLIERTQVVLERAQDKRAEILSETEQEIVDLVLLISRKVIKVISENQRDIIVSNVIQALRKIKGRGDVIIRVNMNDLQLATEHKQDFIKLMEGAKSVQVIEDSSVDSGGCIIETDFGEIDARISSQLAELESKILEISPIKSKIRAGNQQNTAENAQVDHQAASSNLLDLAPPPSSSTSASPSASVPPSNEGEEMSPAANAALTASAALAALATMSVKGRRETDKKMIIT